MSKVKGENISTYSIYSDNHVLETNFFVLIASNYQKPLALSCITYLCVVNNHDIILH